MKRQNFSRQRNAILDVIKSTAVHPSAAWVYENLKEEYPNISLGTVYRNIALLKKLGLVNCVATIDGEERIDGKTEPHAHFICRDCNRIVDIFDCELDEIVSKNSSQLSKGGFTVDGVSVNLYGKCCLCNSKEQ